MFVIGAAGHVDHGKSTLVEALTGIDPDRLAAEKERGLTIDLGFAWMTIPGHQDISIIDVPGHERFVNNMLAGVGGIDMAMLVVAADESVMPQTREHLAILELLGISPAVVAITKSDLVDGELAELVEAEVEDLLEGTGLEGARCIRVSAATGRGLTDLTEAIAATLSDATQRRDIGRPRLPVDRSFTMTGFGTVVTGTLIDGPLGVGDEVELAVSGARSRIRGIQSHREAAESVMPGSRAAVNLTGIAQDAIERGEVLTRPGLLRPTESMDVRLKVLKDIPRPLRHNMHVTVHTGSAETVGRLRLLEADSARPGDWTWAQLKLDARVAVARGDRFVIRSNQSTLGGGSIVDAHAPRHRRRHDPLLRMLNILESGSVREVLSVCADRHGPVDLASLAAMVELSPEQTASELEEMELAGEVVAIETGASRTYIGAAGWDRIAADARRSVSAHHRRFPARRGEPKEELRSRLRLSPALFGPVLERLVATGMLVAAGPAVRTPDHVPSLSADEQDQADRFLTALREADPYSPPTDNLPGEDILDMLEDLGLVVRAGDAVVFSAGAFDRMTEAVRAYTQEHGSITVADVRDLFGTSRKYALALLEHLDRCRITRRVGDARVMREAT